MAFTDTECFRQLAERAISEPDKERRERLLEQLRTMEEIENMRINTVMRMPQITMDETKLGPSMPKTTAPVPQVVPGRLGRRLQLSPHSTEVSDMGRVLQLPPITVTYDLARRMKQRLGLASFINQGEFNVQSRFELRWRK